MSGKTRKATYMWYIFVALWVALAAGTFLMRGHETQALSSLNIAAGPNPASSGGQPAVATATPTPVCPLTWNIVPSLNGDGTGWNDLVDAAALSPSDVWAVGTSANFNPPTSPLPLLEHWDGSTWSLAGSPVITSSQMGGVAGTNSSDVWAVGDYDTQGGRQPMFLHWDGSAWNLAPSAGVIVPQGGVRDVGVVASNDVWVVGSYESVGQSQALAMHWDGSVWTQVSLPVLTNRNSLQGLAVVSASDIWAVGEVDSGTPLFMHYDGTSWTLFNNPVAVSGVLYRASVVSANDIWAVGYLTDGSGLPLTMHYDGTSWSVVDTPYLCCNQQLTDVQAISSNDVWAVSESAFLHWNGSAWAIVHGPNPPASTGYVLEGLTATSFADVWAVGRAHSGAGGGFDDTLTEHYSYACPPPTSTPNPDFTPAPTFTPTQPTTGTPSPSPTNYAVIPGRAPIVPGTNDIGNHCDDCTTTVSLPFTATLYDQQFSSAIVGSNGTLGFVSNPNNFTNDCMPAAAENFAILPYWDDLITDNSSCSTCGIFTSVSGSAPNRIFNIEWRAVHYNTLVPVDFEVRLYESSGRFDLVYGQVDPQGTESIGVQRDTGSMFTRILCLAAGSLGPSNPDGWIIAEGVSLGFGAPPPAPTPTVCPIQFPDVPVGSTFYPYIHCLACLGIVNGFPDGTFRPNANVTRGQLSKIVANSAGFFDPQPNQLFQDVALGSTFQVYIGRLASRGYISGYPCGGVGEPCIPPGNLPYFRTNNNATRGQISKIVSNAAEFADPPSGQQFQDVPEGSTFYTYTYRLVSRAVMSGYACGGTTEPCIPPGNLPYFRTNNNATRGQTSKIVSNTFFPDCDARLGRTR